MNCYYLNKKLSFIIVCLLIIIMPACVQEDPQELPQIEGIAHSAGSSKSASSSLVSQNQVVVRYHDISITEPDKQAIRARFQEEYHFTITSVETCKCDINDIELWNMDTSHPDFTTIEDLITGLQNSEDDDDMDGDFQFRVMILDGDDDDMPIQLDLNLEDRVVDTNNPDAVNVAIIDTGIDYNFLASSVLYNSGQNQSCDNEVSGWDFVNDDYDPMDDHSHGTLVARVIQDELERNEVPYHILPIKAFNYEGRGNYFHTVCALSYIKNNADVDVVNMSFGWSEVTNTSIMDNLISEMDEQTLFVGSAGNDGIDTDQEGNEHFPSGYASTNLITVAGFSPREDVAMGIHDNGTVSGLQLAEYSNYGSTSIDLAAYFTYYVQFQSGRTHVYGNVHGTSYSAAYVTGRAARLRSGEPVYSPTQLKNDVIRTGFVSSVLQGKTNRSRALLSNYNTSGPTHMLTR